MDVDPGGSQIDTKAGSELPAEVYAPSPPWSPMAKLFVASGLVLTVFIAVYLLSIRQLRRAQGKK